MYNIRLFYNIITLELTVLKVQSHRGVGGLISLIALVIVFGVIALAMIDLNLTHALFFKEQNKVTEKLHDRTMEGIGLNVAGTTCHQDGIDQLALLTLELDNTNSQSAEIDSVLLVEKDGIKTHTDALYVDSFNNTQTTDNQIPAATTGHSVSITRNIVYDKETATDTEADEYIVVTTIGNKIINTFDFDPVSSTCTQVSSPPLSPSLSDTDNDDGDITISWNAPDVFDTSIDHYVVESRTNGTYFVKGGQTADGSTTSLTLTDLENDIYHHLRVRAVDASALNGTHSEILKGKP